jgi:hypothetical protein
MRVLRELKRVWPRLKDAALGRWRQVYCSYKDVTHKRKSLRLISGYRDAYIVKGCV